MIEATLGMLGVAVALAVAMLGVRAAQRRGTLHPELSRKLVHITLGLVCLTFPWVFRSAWPVWTLAVLASGVFVSIRTVPVLRAKFGQVLGGVERKSWGELLFPFSVAFVFSLARGHALFYGVPILIMTLADALAALIGKRYGFSRYETDDGWKSVEGSAAFFFTAFLTTHVPLLLVTELGRAECLLVATVMGLIVMLMEAISWRGLDNLFVPLVSYVCLVRLVQLDTNELVTRLVVLALCVAGWSWWRRNTRLTPSAAIAAGLVLFVAWAIGDWNWLIAPVAASLTYAALCRITKPHKRHAVLSIVAIGGVGLCWLALEEIIGTVNTIYPYGVAYGAHLGMIALAAFAHSKRPLAVAMGFAVAAGFFPVAIPYAIVWRDNAHVVPLTAWAAGLVTAAVALFAVAQPGLRDCPADANRWMRQAAIAAVVSGAAFVVISKLEPWSTSFL